MDEISRMERILRGDNTLEPITRLEKFCAKAAGTYTGDPLTPVTRLEWFLDQITGGGGGVTLGTYIFPTYDTYAGPLHYTTAGQNVTAAEGTAYDKVWISDESISSHMFKNVLEHVFLNNTVGASIMAGNTVVKSVYIQSNRTNISGYAFQNCSNLKDLICSNPNEIVKLSNINALSGTPFASGGSGGTVWAPADRIADYQAHTNWAVILGYPNNQIKPLEGSIWE